MTTFRDTMKVSVRGPVDYAGLKIEAKYSVVATHGAEDRVLVIFHYDTEEEANDAAEILNVAIGTAQAVTLPSYPATI